MSAGEPGDDARTGRRAKLARSMRRGLKRHRHEKVKRSAVGAPPGELTADPQAEATRLGYWALVDSQSVFHEDATLEAALAERERSRVFWLNVTGLADTQTIRDVGKAFGLHDLLLEDVVNTDQRPKCEIHEAHAFLVLRGLEAGGASEQIAFVIGKDYVLTFQERSARRFEPVRERIRRGAPRLHSGQADYLAYALVDAVVDSYFPVIDACCQRIETLEDEIFADVGEVQVPEIHALRREMLGLKRFLRPTRDALGILARLTDRPFMSEETAVYLDDVKDHADQLIDINETYLESATSLVDLHMTLSSAKTNEVVNLLTIVSTIFIPLGFLAGLWGMNFNPDISPLNMPLTQSPIGYPVALGVMAAIGVGLLIYFKRKRWI